MALATRAAEQRDVAAIGSLFAELFTKAAHGRPDLFRLPRADDAKERRELELYVASRLDATAEQLIVAEENGTLLGVVHVLVEHVPFAPSVPYRRATTEGWILNVVVGSQHRRRGVGRALDAAARDWARARGAETIGLQVWTYNHEGREFFARLGYEIRTMRLDGRC